MKRGKGRKSKGSLYAFILVVLLVVLGALAIYYKFMKRQQMQETIQTPTTEIEKLIAKDLEMGYPETPKEVMKLFGRINQCLYNKSMSSKDFSAMVGKLRALYCKELKEKNEQGKMEETIREEKNTYSSQKRKIINYTIEEENTYQYKEVEGKELVHLDFSYFIRAKNEYSTVNWYAILVKEDGKWKIREFNPRKKQSQKMTERKK